MDTEYKCTYIYLQQQHQQPHEPQLQAAESVVAKQQQNVTITFNY